MDQDGDDRDFIAIFHNLKGYDGMFLWQHCYNVHRKVKHQITQRTKILSFKLGQVESRSRCVFSRSLWPIFKPPSASRNCARVSFVKSSTPWRTKTTRDLCLTLTTTIPTACRDRSNCSSTLGTALVDILPPYNLHHPVLPYRLKSKLTFPFCRTCVEEEMGKPLLETSCLCPHTPEQCMLRGTWCSAEILKAPDPV